MSQTTLPSEQGGVPLNLAQFEDNHAMVRPSELVTIVAGVITIAGSGRYKVAVESGTEDDLTGITVTGEAIEGCTIKLRPAVDGHIIHVKHQAGLHLNQGVDQDLRTDKSQIILWLHSGSTVWAQEGVVNQVP